MRKPTISLVFLRLSKMIEAGLSPELIWHKLDEITSVKDPQKEIVDFIIARCCETYNVKKNEIITPNWVKKDAVVPRNMAVVLISNHVDGYSIAKIAQLFKKRSPTLSAVIDEFKGMNPKIKHHREFIENFNNLSEEIEEFKNRPL